MNETQEVDVKEKVVVVPPSPAEAQSREAVKEVVNQEPVTTSQAEETPVTEVTQPSAVPAANLDVDEFGVPWKNRAMEWQRKSEQLVDKLPQIIEEKLKTVTQTQQPTYTYEQLEAYKMQNNQDPNIVAWATGEQRKLAASEQRRMFEEIVGQREKQRDAEISKQKAVEYVQQNYPDAFIKDASGKPVGWNMAHPITQQIDALMRNPELSNNPNGLAAAADIAYGRYMKAQAGNLQQTNAQLKREVKTLQKGGLIEGGGKKVVVTQAPQVAAMEQAKKSGTIKDASNSIGLILKQKGILQEE